MFCARPYASSVSPLRPAAANTRLASDALHCVRVIATSSDDTYRGTWFIGARGWPDGYARPADEKTLCSRSLTV
jgi:hypothetical protein